MFVIINQSLPLPVRPIRDLAGIWSHQTPVWGGASDLDRFWVEGEDLWSFWQHPVTGQVRLRIPGKAPETIMRAKIQKPVRLFNPG